MRAIVVHGSAIAPAHQTSRHKWFKDLFDESTLDKLFVHEHMGNNVIIDRVTGRTIFESMPIYVRVGMHLLFYGKEQRKFLKWGSVEELLTKQTINQGQVYNSTDPAIVVPHIESFIKTYSINLDELAEADPKKYSTINDFFARKLKEGARALKEEDKAPGVITSAADCRLTVWETVDEAKKFWVKGKAFSIKALLNNDEALASKFGANPSLAIFRLAPQDYHRFHSPVDGTRGPVTHVPGEFYTVNATIINEEFDVFTANRRDISVIESNTLVAGKTLPVGFVAIGAMLVGAIEWDSAPEATATVKKGEDMGCFKYGGSTCIAIFPEEAHIKWDEDLIKAGQKGVETVIKVGEHIGIVGATPPPANP
ncbi:hypothetical protein DL93DRAFT_2067615 [Clavulina sp. PMI_390]|nr:hypothetical protein DL93DRAFT_2067615 [Clavulina sp. PMI_390]